MFKVSGFTVNGTRLPTGLSNFPSEYHKWGIQIAYGILYEYYRYLLIPLDKCREKADQYWKAFQAEVMDMLPGSWSLEEQVITRWLAGKERECSK